MNTNKVQSTTDETNLALACHLLSFAGYFFPFGNIIAPLILWQVKKQSSKLVDYHGKEVVNFQISMTIYSIIALILVFILIGFVLLFILAIISIVYTIKGAITASKGQDFRYPLTLRLVK